MKIEQENVEFQHSSIPAMTLHAYTQTQYVVQGQGTGIGDILLQVGVQSALLATVHKRYGVECSAFVTACNPLSELRSVGENAARQSELVTVLRARSLRWIGGIGQHPSNKWPAEPSMLVLGLSLESAKVIAQGFEQNAFVWAGTDAIPQLILLR